jgi:hypothetical protein
MAERYGSGMQNAIKEHRALSPRSNAAGTAATLAVGTAIAGAVAVTGWLEKHRARRDQR